ncbi:MAG: hypothetical protein OHK0031_05560 [Anaerolineales bacterium]
MFPTLQLGPLSLQTPGLILLLALWLGLEVMERQARRSSQNAETLYNLVFTALTVGLLGARLSFAAQNFAIFAQTPLSLISPNPGLLDPFGGLALGGLAALVYGRRKNLALWPTLDALTPLFAVMAAGLALSAAAAGTFFGMESGLPWSVELWGAKRHPTQFYALGLALLNLTILTWRTRKNPPQAGGLFRLFVALTAFGWLLVEGLRGDSILLPGGWRLGQILAWVVLAGAGWEKR